MRYVRGIYFWVMAFLVTVFLWGRCCWRHLWVILLKKPRDGRGCHQIASIWGRTIVRFMPGWSVETVGAENLPEDTHPCVVVANHESMSDIWAMYYTGLQFRWLAKNSLFKLPFVGNAMTWSYYVPVLRGNRESHGQAMRDAAARIQMGLSMFFFPEGTRTEDGRIKDFKVGAFKLAHDTQVPVLPIAIHGAADLMRKNSWLPGRAKVKLVVLPSLPPPPKGSDLDEYAARVRALIVDAHRHLV